MRIVANQNPTKQMASDLIGACEIGMWISANNTCMAISQWPSFVVTPDGIVVKQAEHETPAILFTDVDTSLNFHDGTLQLKSLNAPTHSSI